MSTATFYSGSLSNYQDHLKSNFLYDRTHVKWVTNNWIVSVYVAVLYVLLIHAGKFYMAPRKPWDLRILMFLWNVFLSGFSFVVVYMLVPRISQQVQNQGWAKAMCSKYTDEPGIFWGTIFALSKVIELGDTAFIVLRKKPILFLHWYHHSLTLVYSWFIIGDFPFMGVAYSALNASVHTIMYFYFAMKSAFPSIPRWVAQCLTTIQITQMMMALLANSYIAKVYLSGGSCATSLQTVWFSYILVGTNFLLFSNMFYNNYIAVKKAKRF